MLYLALSLSLAGNPCALSLSLHSALLCNFALGQALLQPDTHTHTLPHSNNNLTLFLLLLPRAPLHDRTTFARAPPPSSPPPSLRAQLQTETANETKHQHNFPALKTKWNYDYEKRNPEKVCWINPWRGCTTARKGAGARGRGRAARLTRAEMKTSCFRMKFLNYDVFFGLAVTSQRESLPSSPSSAPIAGH